MNNKLLPKNLVSYEDAVAFLLKNPSQSFTSLTLTENDSFLCVYSISNDEDDPEWVTVGYEGGYFFAYDGEEDVFSLDEVPEEVKNLYFVNSTNFPHISGYNAEHVLYKLFPTLPEPESISSIQERIRFIRIAKEYINKTYRP